MTTLQSEMVRLFLVSYDEFKMRLQRRLGSEHLASDVLQETYLRVYGLSQGITEVKNPKAYLFRIALNIAADQRSAGARLLTGEEVEELLNPADERLDPARVVAGQNDIRTLIEALCELPPRRRQILVAARLEHIPHVDIAERHNVSTRTVEKELKVALAYCAERLEKKSLQQFGLGAVKPS
ncbi:MULTISPECIES: RNA polymerase sigma factor [Halopseudomonas]|jgi:RNA polymerase sigma-70 factor (ECF subfamily)|uniref:RNA polymerase sigma factor n=1 Tax=Halopseudomonas TaxID=2901189 RepID=UPI00039CED83|nr:MULTISPECIES: RNA polymerase sigma factor [Halopseudomonas]MCC4261606.1 RNA polymerase sigma factor [Halopseudomonas aestusnigri]|tara:strand:- start:93 stop:638 length:546 start_codon:yes stop_codon:yes gene_type:complete